MNHTTQASRPVRRQSPIRSSHHGLSQVVVTSFGYLHGPAPAAELTVDVRDVLRDPRVEPALRELTGLESPVRARVLATPGARELVTALLPPIAVLLAAATTGPQHYMVRVAIGCAGGRHRSVVLANELTNRLRIAGISAEVEHRDILRPVVGPPRNGGELP
jgi:UPF0042 nucleotide-binding protein